jgi:hypothetical protein
MQFRNPTDRSFASFDLTIRLNALNTPDHTRGLLADHFLKFSQLLLNDTSYFFDSAFRLEVSIVSQFACSLFSCTFNIV